MRSSRCSTRTNNVVAKSRRKAALASPMLTPKNSAQKSTSSPEQSKGSLNSSWNEDDFVLRLSDESDKSISPKSIQKIVRFDETSLSETWTEIRNKTKICTRARRNGSLTAGNNKPNELPKSMDKCMMTAMVVLEKLSELSLNQWIKPRKGANTERKINSIDDISKKIKRYCLSCAKIVTKVGNKDDELCRKCSTVLLFHCVKCGEKLSTNQAIRRHLELKCT